jgi:hypothetical protein
MMMVNTDMGNEWYKPIDFDVDEQVNIKELLINVIIK